MDKYWWISFLVFWVASATLVAALPQSQAAASRRQSIMWRIGRLAVISAIMGLGMLMNRYPTWSGWGWAGWGFSAAIFWGSMLLFVFLMAFMILDATWEGFLPFFESAVRRFLRFPGSRKGVYSPGS